MIDFPQEDMSGVYIRDYLLRTPIARNRISERYIAQNTVNREQVVAVFLRSSVQQEPELARYFEQRMNRLGAIFHPSLPHLIYAKVPRDSHAFALFKYMPGQLLSDKFQLWRRDKKQMSIIDALTLGHHIASALAVAHSAGLVHYNLGPKHILMDANDKPVLLNLGLPFVALPAAPIEAPTFRQKLDYRAPEQREGLPPTEEGNIFSFGLILYELLTGQYLALPLSNEAEFDSQALSAQLTPERLGGKLAPETYELVRDCLLQSTPTYLATATALVAALERAIAVERQRLPLLQTAWPQLKRYGWLFLLIPLFILAFTLIDNQPNAAAELEAIRPTRTAVATAIISPTANPIALQMPPDDSQFGLQETITFSWQYPWPIEADQELILYLIKEEGTQLLSIIDQVIPGHEYQFQVSALTLGLASNSYQWQVAVRNRENGRILFASEPRLLQIVPDLPTPNPTATATLVPTHLNNDQPLTLYFPIIYKP